MNKEANKKNGLEKKAPKILILTPLQTTQVSGGRPNFPTPHRCPTPVG